MFAEILGFVLAALLIAIKVGVYAAGGFVTYLFLTDSSTTNPQSRLEWTALYLYCIFWAVAIPVHLVVGIVGHLIERS
jgi:hypothetical protein